MIPTIPAAIDALRLKIATIHKSSAIGHKIIRSKIPTVKAEAAVKEAFQSQVPAFWYQFTVLQSGGLFAVKGRNTEIRKITIPTKATIFQE